MLSLFLWKGFFFNLVEIFYCIICFCLFYWVLTFMVFIYYSFFFVLGLVFTTSRFGKPVVIFGNYRFNKYYKCVGPKARWACTRRNCRAVLITIDDTLVAHKDCHNHPWSLFYCLYFTMKITCQLILCKRNY